MQFLNLFLTLAGFISLTMSAANALTVPPTHVVHEQRDLTSASSIWTKLARVSPDSILPVRIGLSQSNLDIAHGHLLQLSDPSSSKYGKHWTSDQVLDFFQPSNDTVNNVTKWLSENGIKYVTHSDNKAWLAFDAPASLVKALLYTEYYKYENQITGGRMPACDACHVPSDIQRHIDYITPGIKLSTPMHAEAQGIMRHRAMDGMCSATLTFTKIQY